MSFQNLDFAKTAFDTRIIVSIIPTTFRCSDDAFLPHVFAHSCFFCGFTERDGCAARMVVLRSRSEKLQCAKHTGAFSVMMVLLQCAVTLTGPQAMISSTTTARAVLPVTGFVATRRRKV